MAELRAYIVYTPREGVVEGLWESYSIRIDGVEVYLRSDVDKVISELKTDHKKVCSKLQDAEMKLSLGLGTSAEVDAYIAAMNKRHTERIEAYQRRLDAAQAEVDCLLGSLLHNKYKRCLEMSKMCEARYSEEDAKVNGNGVSWEYISKEMKYWERWRWRWDALAEKFKPEAK